MKLNAACYKVKILMRLNIFLHQLRHLTYKKVSMLYTNSAISKDFNCLTILIPGVFFLLSITICIYDWSLWKLIMNCLTISATARNGKTVTEGQLFTFFSVSTVKSFYQIICWWKIVQGKMVSTLLQGY